MHSGTTNPEAGDVYDGAAGRMLSAPMSSTSIPSDSGAGGSVAALYSEITEMQQRRIRAEGDRDAWRAAGMQEKHLEACSLVDALELQLARLSEGLRQARARDSKTARDEQADITYDGRQYRYGSYRYDRREDAVAYAQIARARGEVPDFSGSSAVGDPLPGRADTALMAELGITLDERGGYRFGLYRYDRLADALNYAKRARRPLGA